MTDKPIPKVAKIVKERLDSSLIELGGLDDAHLKHLTFYVKHQLGLPNFRFRIDYRATPKTLTIHINDKNGNEVFVRPKEADVLDKIRIYLGLDQWNFEFAKGKQDV